MMCVCDFSIVMRDVLKTLLITGHFHKLLLVTLHHLRVCRCQFFCFFILSVVVMFG